MRLSAHPHADTTGKVGTRGDMQRRTAAVRSMWMHAVLDFPDMSGRDRAVVVAHRMLQAGWKVTSDTVRRHIQIHDPRGKITSSLLQFVRNAPQATDGTEAVISALCLFLYLPPCIFDNVHTWQRPQDTPSPVVHGDTPSTGQNRVGTPCTGDTLPFFDPEACQALAPPAGNV
jgi:hypothetical protein